MRVVTGIFVWLLMFTVTLYGVMIVGVRLLDWSSKGQNEAQGDMGIAVLALPLALVVASGCSYVAVRRKGSR